jgi:N-acetylglutamate synthase
MPERAPMVTAARIDELANRGWPAIESHAIEGWLVRASHGVTRRANSVLPFGHVDDMNRAIDEVEKAYRAREIRPAFQLSPASRPQGLAARLECRGYTEEGETLVLIAPTERVIRAAGEHANAHAANAQPAGEHTNPQAAGEHRNAHHSQPLSAASVAVHPEPGEDWLSLWWDVDGRGGHDKRAVARRILIGTPALYASVRHEDSVLAVGRLALVDDWGGLYAIATRPEHRRLGHARRVVATLANHALLAGAACLWLQVLAANEAALALYLSLGFEPVSGYAYWVAPAGTSSADFTLPAVPA